MAGYPIFIPLDSYGGDSVYACSTSGDVLKISKDDHDLLSISFDNLLTLQFARVGLDAHGATLSLDTLKKYRDELMMWRTDSISVLFSSMSFDLHADKPTLWDLSVLGVALPHNQ